MMTVVSNPRADADEKIERAARILRASKQNKEVFKAIYAGRKRFKSIEDIKRFVSNFNNNTYAAAARLFSEDIVDRKIVDGYGKKDFYIHNRQRILRMSENLARLKKVPTKRKVQVQIAPSSTFRFRTNPKVQQLYIDDVDSFKKVRRIRKADAIVVHNLAERTINTGLCRILNQSEKKDWGGERHDIYTNKIIFRGSRRSAAFALKGKAIKSKLTPGKMGKNGDQASWSFPDCAPLHPGYGLSQNSGASARRERERLSAPARSAGEGDHAKHGGGGVLSRGFFCDERASFTAACPFRPSGGPPPPQSRALQGRMKRAHVASQ
jgi:hypothetical protein